MVIGLKQVRVSIGTYNPGQKYLETLTYFYVLLPSPPPPSPEQCCVDCKHPKETLEQQQHCLFLRSWLN